MAPEKLAELMSIEELRALVPELQQLTEKYKQAEALQKALFDISELANSVSELSRLYPAIHNIISGMMDAANFFVALHHSSSDMVEFVYVVDEFDESLEREVPFSEIKHGFTGYILTTGNPLYLTKENLQEQMQATGIQGIGTMPVDWVGVPLRRGSQTIGAMVVQSYDDSIRYQERDKELLAFVSQHIVNALDRVKNRELTEKTIRERTRQLRHMNEELQDEIQERQKIESLQQALFEISELSANVEGDMQDFYSNLHDILARLLSAPNCYIAILDRAKSTLSFPYFSDELDQGVAPRPLGKGLTEFVLTTGQAELINAERSILLSEQGQLDKDISERMLDRETSWLGSPLVVDGEISGVIAVQTYEKSKGYTFKDLELLRFVSHHIAVAMERKRVADAMQAINQQLAEKVRERTDELYKTNQHLKKQIEERKEIELRLIHDAHHDALTDLPNRVMFTNRLELAVANKKRHPEHNFAVLFIDLDRFKLINDTIGHHAGDMFLIEVSKRLAQCIRGHDLLARLGGDEFVILLDSLEQEEDAEEVAARIIELLAKPFVLDDKEMYSGASIGIAFIQKWYKKAEEVIRDADAAMYQAKALGRGRFMSFDSSMRERLLEELELESEFRHMLKEGLFECYCQPAVNLDNQEWVYLECYIRWQHPTLGKVKREQFWQVAEHSGLTIEMDNFMLERACRCLKQMQNGVGHTAYIALNLSINHLLQTKLVNQMLEQVEAAGISPSQLVLEFDENDLNKRSAHILPALKKLKKAGVTLVLDNFGSGLASLAYLYSYPFDYVKIDHRFVKSLPRSDKNLKMIQSVISIAEHLGFKLIAEGIENQAQYDALREIGCQYGQGSFVVGSQRMDQLTSLPFKAINA
ncbi:bifunctional diguanylate cyclase/phosphodiesterase [Bowmanella pacifica]|uniref:Bifunctional diguanylate cyclase/phosphodiesterase n=1 Tax=Bowmanella pacifica TaxID=502051 RepID=A0A917YUI7_9ALTE|nr:EAL domain-containing protein [Bowmanella pacifica]GGO66361.1 bifunctional diguanylate cyclase/phosphodiesterase [Bowmanella pacifica]